MSRKHRKKLRQKGYLPGVTWEDVLKRRPVTRSDVQRRERTPRPKIDMKCRDCPASEKVYRGFRGAVPNKRCLACGGVMDPVSASAPSVPAA